MGRRKNKLELQGMISNFKAVQAIRKSGCGRVSIPAVVLDTRGERSWPPWIKCHKAWLTNDFLRLWKLVCFVLNGGSVRERIQEIS